MRARFLFAATIIATRLAAAEPATPDKAPEAPPPDSLYETGKAMFDEFAPPEIKEQFEFPSRERWDAFAGRLQQALEGNDLAALARYEPEAKAALAALRVLPGYEDYADWLQVRLDYIEAAKVAARISRPPLPGTKPEPKTGSIPFYDLWLARIQARPVPSRAAELMPVLQNAFGAEGVPPELAWLAEAESTLNPSARSPSGARGLFQLMPETARGLGLSTFLPDDRTDVEKSARATARYLRALRKKFGDWPLAFAAYNAGEGRVQRRLASRHGRTFADVSSALPSETRMYVPKVCATIAVRAGVDPNHLSGLQEGAAARFEGSQAISREWERKPGQGRGEQWQTRSSASAADGINISWI